MVEFSGVVCAARRHQPEAEERTTINGKTVRPLGAESDKALALPNTLDEKQRKNAILGNEFADLVLDPGQDGKIIQPEGLKASEMSERQRTMLLDVISEWAGIIHESAATASMAEGCVANTVRAFLIGLARHATGRAGTIQRTPFRIRDHYFVHAPLSSIRSELAKSGRDHGRTERACGWRYGLALNSTVRAGTQSALSAGAAPDEWILACRRNLPPRRRKVDPFI